MSQHGKKGAPLTQNQNNQLSDDPGDGSRGSFVLGRDGPRTPVEESPEEEAQNQSAIEDFGREGAGQKG
jgi:hypothetical protein